jgi:hypothetical protein
VESGERTSATGWRKKENIHVAIPIVAVVEEELLLSHHHRCATTTSHCDYSRFCCCCQYLAEKRIPVRYHQQWSDSNSDINYINDDDDEPSK